MAKPSAYAAELQRRQKIRDQQMRAFSRTFTMDIVTIALGKMGFTPDDILKFRDYYCETENEFVEEVTEDFYNVSGKDIAVAKEHIDRAIKEYVPDEMFLPYDVRYGKAFE